VEITGEPAFPVHPHSEQQCCQIINGLTTIAAERGTAHSDHTALARLSRRLP
jgi:alpha-ketoglutarate-dependent taurine dioxygenase